MALVIRMHSFARDSGSLITDKVNGVLHSLPYFVSLAAFKKLSY